MSKKLTKRQKEYIRSCYKKKSDSELAKALGLNELVIRKTKEKLGLQRAKEKPDGMRRKPELPTDVHAEKAQEKLSQGADGMKLGFSLLTILLIVMIAISIYANSFKNSFIWDDQALVLDNPYIKSTNYIKEIFTKHLFHGSGTVSNFYRPMQSLTLLIDYHFWRLNPFGYHLTNLFFHTLNAILIYFLILLITKNQKIAYDGFFIAPN